MCVQSLGVVDLAVRTHGGQKDVVEGALGLLFALSEQPENQVALVHVLGAVVPALMNLVTVPTIAQLGMGFLW